MLFLVQDRSKLAAERLRDLVDQMGEELRHKHGWKAEVSRRLGVSPSVIAHVQAENRGVGVQTIETIVERLKIDREFFYARRLSSDRYRDYLGGEIEVKVELESDPASAGYAEFVTQWELGRMLTASSDPAHQKILEDLRSCRLHGSMDTGAFFHSLAQARLDELRRGPVSEIVVEPPALRPGRRRMVPKT